MAFLVMFSLHATDDQTQRYMALRVSALIGINMEPIWCPAQNGAEGFTHRAMAAVLCVMAKSDTATTALVRYR
jgi:hypothetical protein